MVLIDADKLPRHVGIIMDGNGRWASLRQLPRKDGHREGSRAVRRVVRLARRVGIEALTLYAFSFQNWDRPHDEVLALMRLLVEYLVDERDEILTNGIRLEAVGDLDRLPAPVRSALDELRKASADNHGMVLTLALSYGGREEIAAAARDLACAAARGEIDPNPIDAALLGSRLPSLRVGEPDLVIRTGGEKRISNFLLYGLAYAELHFCDRLWPDFSEDDFFAALASYQQRERRFGLVGAAEPAAHARLADRRSA